MRSSWKSSVAVAVGLLVLPQLAAADDVQDQLQQMQERMSQLEDKLAATTDQLDDSTRKAAEQQKLIERAGLDDRAAASGVSSFFEEVEFGGWVAASYWWNFSDPGDGFGAGQNVGTFGLANPFHPDHNTFQLDQLWLEMAKEATPESRGGFAADLVMGKTSDLLVGGGGDGNGNNISVYQAYAEYLAPLGPGVRVKAGRFATHIGAEVAQTVYNFNITRGLVYSVLQPINHVGVFASTEMDNGFSLGGGVVNDGLLNLNTDVGDRKAYQWHAGFSQEGWGISHNGEYGRIGGPGVAGFNAGIADFVLTWDPSENLSTWADITYTWTDDTNTAAIDPWAVGIALAGRLAITEATGFAVRGEYIRSEDNFLGTGAAGSATSQDLWSITGTVDHELAENLTLRGEVRYEEGAQLGPNSVFYFDSPTSLASGTSSNQVMIGAEMAYRF